MQKRAKDLITLPIEAIDNISDTKFRLVHIAAQRVRQLSTGAPIQVDTGSIKDTTIALEEALERKLRILTGEEAQKAKEEFRKQEERAKMEEQLSAKEEEIRKELSAYLSETTEEESSEGGGETEREEPANGDMGEEDALDDSDETEDSEEE